MSQETRNDLTQQSQQLLQGQLKHARAAALALALVPLAAVAASTQAQEGDTFCPSAGICGTVFFDSNGNGIQDAGDGVISGASVTITFTPEGGGTPTETVVQTNDSGFFELNTVPEGATFTVSVQIPNDMTPTLANVGSDDTVDSDGVADGPNSVAQGTLTLTTAATTDFGFKATSGFTNPGTGTPGYWKNHPEAWPVSTIQIGTVTYTVDQAIAIMNSPVQKDKTFTMFASLVSAILNVKINNDSSCVSDAITAGQAWMTTNGPVGKGVAASSFAWKLGEPIHRLMDNYNNGMLCAPHRD
jgi:hypothetical protein